MDVFRLLFTARLDYNWGGEGGLKSTSLRYGFTSLCSSEERVLRVYSISDL